MFMGHFYGVMTEGIQLGDAKRVGFFLNTKDCRAFLQSGTAAWALSIPDDVLMPCCSLQHLGGDGTWVGITQKGTQHAPSVWEPEVPRNPIVHWNRDYRSIVSVGRGDTSMKGRGLIVNECFRGSSNSGSDTDLYQQCRSELLCESRGPKRGDGNVHYLKSTVSHTARDKRFEADAALDTEIKRVMKQLVIDLYKQEVKSTTKKKRRQKTQQANSADADDTSGLPEEPAAAEKRYACLPDALRNELLRYIGLGKGTAEKMILRKLLRIYCSQESVTGVMPSEILDDVRKLIEAGKTSNENMEAVSNVLADVRCNLMKFGIGPLIVQLIEMQISTRGVIFQCTLEFLALCGKCFINECTVTHTHGPLRCHFVYT